MKRKGRVEKYQSKLKRKNGSPFWVEFTAAINEKEDYIEGVLIDITERKEAEKMLLESEEKYRSLFDNLQNGYVFNEIVLDENNEPVDYIFRDVN